MEYTLKEYWNAYVKASGLFVPTKFLWRPFGTLLEVDRCAVDGGLVTNSANSLSRHLGHRLNQPVLISLFEMFKVWTRIIR